MRSRIVLIVVGLFMLAPAALAQGSAAVIWPAADIKWTDMQGGPPGVKTATLWGDMSKGAFGALIKFPAGTITPLHTHTHDMKVVVVSGTWIHTPEGKPPVNMTAGSYLMQPGGSYRHVTSCGQGSECLIFVESNGAFDLKPVEDAKAPAKK